MNMSVMEATGRATCKICKKTIEKNQKSILVSGYQCGGQVHSDPKECEGR